MSFIQNLLELQYGYVTDKDIPEIIKENRLQQVIVRCGSGRFICPAQDLQHFIGIIEREKSEYIRDVSIFRSPK